VRGDALRVRQIASNFLHNALKFTASGHIALVAQRQANGWVRLEVEDSGPGIAPATQQRLFQPFTQADESTTRRYGGTGLGLSICHALAQLMGGRVGLHSVPGQGSTFFAELPLPAEQTGAPESPQDRLDDGRLRGVRVLLVEDNPINMMIGVHLLEHWGVQVTQAANGRAALAAVAAAQATGQAFAAVLMDVQMPDLSGHEVTQALRQHYSAQQLPVIALTAAALVSERELALVSGMNDFITKPIDPDRLLEALLRVLASTALPEAQH
jgi:CheY-like chemotaxis protein